MTLSTAEIVIHGTAPTVAPVEFTEVRYALKVTFGPGQVVWVPSHDDVIPQLPPGASYTEHARIAEGDMPDISRNAGFISGTSTISTPTYRVVDVDDEFSDLIANKNLNGFGTKNAGISEYEFGADVDTITDIVPKYTGTIQNHTKPFNVVVLETADINRNLDEDVMDPKLWNLSTHITASQATIPTTLSPLQVAANQFLFEHTAGYLADPLKTVGYCRISKTGEIFSYTAFEDVNGTATFTGCTRGVLGTQAGAVNDFNVSTEATKKPEIEEWIVLHETATTMAIGMITGTMGLRPMPEHWAAQAPDESVNRASMAAYSTTFKLQFQNYGKVKCREFIEKEILSPMRAVLVVDGWGTLNWTPSVLPIDENAGEIVLDESNCVTTNEIELRHIKDDIYPSIKLHTDWNPIAEKFLSPVTYQDYESASHNKLPIDRTKEYSFKGIHVGIHTDAQKRRLAAAFGDDHFFEKLGLTIESYVRNIPLGTLVTVVFNNVRDDAAGSASSQSIQRTMMVTEATEKRSTRTSVYELSGSMYIQSNRQAGQSLHNMEPAEYRRGRINLANSALFPGMSIVNGIAAGSLTLQNGKEYYYVDDAEEGEGLEFSSSLNVTISGNGPSVKLFVFGPFINRTTIDLTAKSHHRVGLGGTQSTPDRGGESGYCMSTRSTGSFDTEIRYGALLSSDRYYYPVQGFKVTVGTRGNYTSGLYARAPDVVLDLNDGILGGLPNDLSGSGGPGGPVSKHYDSGKRPNLPSSSNNHPSQPSTRYLNGSSGGLGGGGLVIFSWGGGNASGGKIILSGGPSSAANSLDVDQATVMGGRGGGGGPGSLLWIVDGGLHSPPLLTSADVIAYHGEASVSATAITGLDNYNHDDTGTYRSPGVATPRSNQYEAVTRVVYTPEAENIESRIDNEVDLFFQNQRDGQVELIVSLFRPSNANVGDMWITPANLESSNTHPTAEVLDNSGWRTLDWNTDNRVYEFLLFSRREYGGNTVHFGTTRPTDYDDGDLWRDPNQDVTWVLHTQGFDEILTRSGVQVGDERLADPNFVLTASAGVPYTWHWHVTSDVLEMPILTVATKGVVDLGNTLQPPFNLSAAVYGNKYIEIFWENPSDMSNVTGFEVYMNGIYEATKLITESSYSTSELPAGATYVMGVKSVGDNGATSPLTTTTVVLAPDVVSGTQILSVEISGGFKEGVAPSGGTSPTITLISAGPTIQISTTNVEDTRGVFISFTGGFNTTVPVSNDAMSYTPPTPSSLSGQSFSLYVENDAGQAVSLASTPYEDGINNANTPPAVENPSGPPQLLTPVDGANIYGSTHLFEFVPNSTSVTDWYIRLGNSGVPSTEYLDWRANTPTPRSYSVTTLPANGTLVYCEFSWKTISGGWTIVNTTFTSNAA